MVVVVCVSVCDERACLNGVKVSRVMDCWLNLNLFIHIFNAISNDKCEFQQEKKKYISKVGK